MSYVRVSILGATAGGEVWSINPVFDPTGEFPGGVNQENLDAAAAGIAALSPGSALLIDLSTMLSITGARVEVREDSNDALIGISVATRATPLPGTTPPTLPPQSAVVVSLRTNTPGASGRGRLYWPFLTNGLDATGHITATNVTNTLAGMKTYLVGMRDILATSFPLIGFDPAVRSRLTKSTPHVARLQVGNVVDTQRRRRDKWPESYQTVSYP